MDDGTASERTAGEVMAAYGEAWARGEPEAAFAFYADDVVMRLPGRSALAGVHRGKPAVIACIDALLRRTDGHEATVEVLDRVVGERHVVMLVREVVRRGGDVLELRRANTYRVDGGRIVEIDIFEADQYEVDEFFG